MTITMIENKLEGQYARPHDYPIITANPAPWRIDQVKIEVNPIKIWIRGENSMWFRAEHCWIGEYDELKDEPNAHWICTPADSIFEQLGDAYKLKETKPLFADISIMSVALKLRKLYPTARLSEDAKHLLGVATEFANTLKGD
jgi:hypothetical protein